MRGDKAAVTDVAETIGVGVAFCGHVYIAGGPGLQGFPGDGVAAFVTAEIMIGLSFSFTGILESVSLVVRPGNAQDIEHIEEQ